MKRTNHISNGIKGIFSIKKEALLGLLFCYYKKFKNVPGGIRTPDRRLRRALLYPAELLRLVATKEYIVNFVVDQI